MLLTNVWPVWLTRPATLNGPGPAVTLLLLLKALNAVLAVAGVDGDVVSISR
jgi:hypothetical protein